jgi:hypothetical protein
MPSEKPKLTAREWIHDRISKSEKGYCSSVAIFGRRRPDHLTEPDLAAELRRMRDAGELRFTDGKWWRP